MYYITIWDIYRYTLINCLLTPFELKERNSYKYPLQYEVDKVMQNSA